MGRRVAATASVPVMRMAHPLAFAGFLKSIGAPVDSAFRRARLPLQCEDPNSYVPVTRARSFYEDMAARESEALGWATGRWAHDNKLHHGLLSHLATAPTLRRALQDLAALVTAENSHIRLGMTPCGEDVLFWVHDTFDQNTPGYLVAQGYSLEIMLAVLRHFAGRSWSPAEVGVQALSVPKFAAPILPGTRIRVGQKVGYIRFPRTFLSLQPHRPWSKAHGGGEAGAPLTLTDRLDFKGSLQLVLESYLADGCPLVEQAAALVGSSERTFRRRLQDEGLTYSKLVDQVRFEVAKRLLKDPDAKMIDVAYAAGYSEPAHFSRSFRRMTGVSPSAYRRVNFGTEASGRASTQHSVEKKPVRWIAVK